MKTLQEIAKECNVSTSTVSLVLNKPYKISKEVREKVYDTIIRVGYFKEKGQNIRNMGVIFNNFYKDFFGDFYGEVTYGILQKTSELSCNIRIMPHFDMEYYDIHDLQGLVFVGKMPNGYYEKAKKYHIPHVQCGHPSYRHMDTPTVYLSRQTNTKHLIQFVLNCGHKDIAVIVGEHDFKDIIRKEFVDTIKEYNPYFDDSLIFQADYDEIQTVEIVWNRIISHKPRITAVMCSNDLLAYYVYRCAEKYSTNIPDQISVTGFDGINFPRVSVEPAPKLTTVYGDRIELGRKSVELLYKLLQGITPEDKWLRLDGNLRIGNSVARFK